MQCLLMEDIIINWLCPVACGILVPWPGIELRLLAEKVPSPNHWTTRESPIMDDIKGKMSHHGISDSDIWHDFFS